MNIINDLFGINHLAVFKYADIVAGKDLAGVFVKLNLIGLNRDIPVFYDGVAGSLGDAKILIVVSEIALNIEVRRLFTVLRVDKGSRDKSGTKPHKGGKDSNPTLHGSLVAVWVTNQIGKHGSETQA